MFGAPKPSLGVFAGPERGMKTRRHGHGRRQGHAYGRREGFTRVKAEKDTPIVYVDKKDWKADRQRAHGVPAFEDDKFMVPKEPKGQVFAPESSVFGPEGKQVRFDRSSLQSRHNRKIDFRNERAGMYSEKYETFRPVNPVPIPGEVPADIRPDTELYSSAEGLFGLGQTDLINKVKAIASDPQVKSVISAGKDIYAAYKGTKKPAAARLTQDVPAPTTTLARPGMSLQTKLLIAGGGVAVLALGLILLKRRK